MSNRLSPLAEHLIQAGNLRHSVFYGPALPLDLLAAALEELGDKSCAMVAFKASFIGGNQLTPYTREDATVRAIQYKGGFYDLHGKGLRQVAMRAAQRRYPGQDNVSAKVLAKPYPLPANPDKSLDRYRVMLVAGQEKISEQQRKTLENSTVKPQAKMASRVRL